MKKLKIEMFAARFVMRVRPYKRADQKITNIQVQNILKELSTGQAADFDAAAFRGRQSRPSEVLELY